MQRKSFITGGIVTLAAVGMLGAGFVWSGIYNIAADDAHTRPVHALLETLRERSIDARISDGKPPFDLSDPERIRQGAGNYNAMCMGCHLAPGMDETELSLGLYPAPPALAKVRVDADEAFWIIKHGIKASGMPAWGKSMDDEYIWNMAAFVQQLPGMDAAEYEAMVASSGGHDHGGGEMIEQTHADGAPADHHDTPPQDHGNMPMGDAAVETGGHAHGPGVADDHHAAASTPAAKPVTGGATMTHRHADGTVESHPAPPAKTDAAPVPAADGHDHQHQH